MDTADTAIPAPPQSISATDLYRLLGSPRFPLVIDVRKAPAFDADDSMLPAALRAPPDAIAGWTPRATGSLHSSETGSVPPAAPGGTSHMGQAVVVYCVHGHEVSQQAAKTLASRGFDARYLDGGIGLWREIGLPLMKKSTAFGIPRDAPSQWVTREHPKIDRIACPWLVRRFIDPQAEFLYVPTAEVFDVASSTGAIAYDIPGAPLEHDGELCSFDAFLGAFGLDDPALDDLALIVRGADTGRPNLTPQSHGLLAISLGLSHNFPDDHQMLEQGMVVYDALYAWCRHARDVEHNWLPQAAVTA